MSPPERASRLRKGVAGQAWHNAFQCLGDRSGPFRRFFASAFASFADFTFLRRAFASFVG
jgi:hypothetical protein